MRTLLRLKRADAVLQVLAFAMPFIIAAVEKKNYLIFICYITVGSVQSVSCICHLFMHNKYKLQRRKAYTQLWVVIILLGIILWISGMPANSNAEGFGILFGFVLLFVSPMMALWYFFISVEEIYIIRDVMNKDDRDTKAV